MDFHVYSLLINCLLLLGILLQISHSAEQTPASVNRDPDHAASQIVHLEKLNSKQPRGNLHPSQAWPYLTSVPAACFGIRGFGIAFDICLYKDRPFLSPSFHIEHHWEDNVIRQSVPHEEHSCLYRGHVLNETGSRVVLNACAGLHGLIQASFGDFYLEPLQKGLDEAPLHVVARRRHRLSRVGPPKRMAGEKTEPCGVKDPNPSSHQAVHNNYKLSVNATGYVEATPTHPRRRRSMSWRRYVETMVVADESMFDFYGGKELDLRRYLLSAMAIVTSIFRDGSIGNAIDIAVVKLVILKKNPKSLRVRRTAAKSLKSFCQWQNKRNKRSDGDPEHFDTAILITRKDLCSSFGKCDTLGLAELGTICNPYRSCSVVEDNGLSVGFTIAHELGHLFDSPHDGDHNTCNRRSGEIHIMTPSFTIESKTWSWSRCSRKYITEFLESGQGHCLFDKPSARSEYHLSNKLPGEVYSPDAQCRLIFGPNSTACPYIRSCAQNGPCYDRLTQWTTSEQKIKEGFNDEPWLLEMIKERDRYDLKTCSQLWCTKEHGRSKACQTNNMPWVDGTPCGEEKWEWCIRGRCVKRKNFKPVNGGWGEWQSYGPCSRSCGGGIQYSVRECNRPRPEHGGNFCLGLRRRYRSCNTEKCDNGLDTFRATQCAAFNGKDLGIQGISNAVHWKPKYAGVRSSDVCRLFCEVSGYKIYYELASRVIDGTPCRPNSFDICVEGKCRPAGCDRKLNSDAKLDKCGVCKGDNSSCRTYSGAKNTTKYGYNFVVHVPIGASNLKVTQTSVNKEVADTNFLAVIGSRGRYIFNGNFVVSLGSKKYVDLDQDIFYSGSDARDESIWIPGIIKRPVIVHVLSVGQLMPPNIHYSFNVPVYGQQNYSWVLDPYFGDCDFICQGSQERVHRCQRQLDSQQVADNKCAGTKPDPVVRKCNRHCKMMWSIKIDSECSPPCGKGYRYQSAVCVKKFGNLSQHDEVVHDKFCRQIPKPPKRVSCTSECSNTRWIYTEWGKCSKECGGGMQQREARCVDQTMRKVPHKECASSQLGPLERNCNNIGCPQWKLGEWSLCSVTCGKGIQHREVFCVTGLNKRTKSSVCDAESKPSNTQPCELLGCPSWHYGAWTRCSVNCGIGYQTRKVGCRRADGELVDDSECNFADRPLDRVECSGGQCPVIAHAAQESNEDQARAIWMTGAWTECSKSCGLGMRERYVSCRYMNGEEAPEKLCGLDRKPATLEKCTVSLCPAWQIGEWSECTEVCGGGTRTRQVFCGFQDGRKEEDHVCITETKPTERQSCNDRACTTEEPIVNNRKLTSSGTWEVEAWGPCSVTCGFGLRSRKVHCVAEGAESCLAKEQPPSTTVCRAGPCPGWNYGLWSSCSVTCGQGVRQRDVWCAFENGTKASLTSCNPGFRPSFLQTCKQRQCPDLARWTVGVWQPCSVTCGKGFQFREVTCENGQGVRQPERQCSIYSKPTNQQPCNSHVCPHWIVSDWSECDSSCAQSRQVFCGTGVDHFEDEVCSLESKPMSTRECTATNCVKAPRFSWKLGPWGVCAKTCGYSVRSRNVTCVDSQGVSVPLRHCNTTESMPKTLEACFGGVCMPKWTAGPWSECSASCGNGVQGREVVCEDMLGRQLHRGGCPTREKPSAWRLCNLGECQDTFHWRPGNWSKCSAQCGIGFTKRTVACMDSEGNQHKDSRCTHKRPPNFKACNLRACPPTSCKSVQKQRGIHYDGEHYLLVGGRSYLKVYCAGMDTVKPKEYITLRADPKENFSEIYGKRLRNRKICPNNGTRPQECEDCVDYSASGTTYFSKVRINLNSMVIVTGDKKFAVKFGRNPPPFASAGDCFSQAHCPQGRFRVNLKGTGLRIDPSVQWTSRGYFSSQEVERKLDGELVTGKCGGYCGMCSPVTTGLKVGLVSR